MLSLSSIKTPGVYVDEVPKFPPSVAAVETAIPAFLGYTERAQNIQPGDLLNVPTKIGSLAEYEEKYGGGATPQVANVTLDAANNFKSAALTNQFYLYDSLRLFYTNGGGDCYIISVATYASAANTAGEFAAGLAALEKEDRPTMMVFPDNSLLTTGSDYYTVYDSALLQCSNLKDRVGVFDVKENDPNGADFRSGIGINSLKYGAAYTPWLQVNFPKNIRYRDFRTVIFKESTNVTLGGLATDPGIQAEIASYEQVMAGADLISAATDALNGTQNTLRERYIELEATYQGAKTGANMQALVNFLFDFARQLDTLAGAGAGSVANVDLNTALKGAISSTMAGIFATLIGHDKELAAEVTGGAYSTRHDQATVPTAAEWGGIFGGTPPASTVIAGSGATNNPQRMDAMLPSLQSVFDNIDAAWQGNVVAAGASLENKKHEGLLDAFPIYKTLITGIQNTNTYVPPSGAVAGIYAFVDRTRGVWKAPANVSVAGVIGPKDRFTASELDALNVDVNAGKSINAIRSFTGKGTLVFGARTLAGNDAEWRYVSVRRFFNMVEESVKKASEQFVFEPNDANTWIKVQAMIENFLNLQWRAGALQGAKPEHAYYVAVGLGKTMTPQNILDGFMIVEIGMAVVRPAEFIVLRFSHKMAES